MIEPAKRRSIVLVVARADNGVIGKSGGLPWHLSTDLKRFKRLTVGKPVVMGRKTYQSIGKPLPGRHNIVVTRDAAFQAPGCTVVPNLAEAIAAPGLDPKVQPDEVMIIGGADIYAQALPFADRIELTEVHINAEGDTRLADFDRDTWQEIARHHHGADGDAPAHSFVTLVRHSDS